MKRVGILLVLAALAAPAQTRSMGSQHGTMSMSSSGRGAAPPANVVSRGMPGGAWHQGNGGDWHHGNGNGGVRVGNWTFRTGPVNPGYRGCPGFNCVSYPYYPSYYPIISVPYYPSYGYATTYDPYPIPPSAPAVPEGQYIMDSGTGAAAQSSAYDAGYAAGLQTQAATASRYGNHYLDSRENAQPAEQPHQQPSVIEIPGPAATPRSYTSAPAPIGPATVLVFKDGHTAEVHNYAIIGQTLWNLSEQNARKIPLSDLNLDATVRANDDRGITFKVPGNHD